jgi:hypothetical protein
MTSTPTITETIARASLTVSVEDYGIVAAALAQFQIDARHNVGADPENKEEWKDQHEAAARIARDLSNQAILVPPHELY